MDSTRAYLKALVETKKGVNLRTLSRQIKKNDAYLHQYIYRGTPKTLPENLRYHLATLLGIHESELRETAQDIAIPDAVFLPWLDIDISAGHGSISDDLAEAGDSWVFDRQFLQQISHADISVLRMLSVKGDSMSPVLEDGNMILIDLNDTQPSPPGIFVLFDGVGLMTKSVKLIPHSTAGQVRIAPANPHYSAYQRSYDDIRIVGRVIWFSRRLVRSGASRHF